MNGIATLKLASPTSSIAIDRRRQHEFIHIDAEILDTFVDEECVIALANSEQIAS